MSEADLSLAYARLDAALQILESGGGPGGRSPLPEAAVSPASAQLEHRLKELETRTRAAEQERDALQDEKAALQDRYNDLALAFDEMRDELGVVVADKLPEFDSLRRAYDELERAHNDVQNELAMLKAMVTPVMDDGDKTAASEALKSELLTRKTEIMRVEQVQAEAVQRLDGAIARLEALDS